MASMSQTLTKRDKPGERPEPTWAIAELFPPQGLWSEEEYLALQTNRLMEFSDGFLEVLPAPTMSHQLLSANLYGLILAFVSSRNLGTVLFAPLRIRLRSGKYREPDIVFMSRQHADRIGEDFWKGADLALEIVSDSPEDRRRDLVAKRGEYARARIPEYWIVDPREERITVLRLSGRRYVVHGTFSGGDTATSHLLAGFTVDVTAAFASASAVPGKGKARRKSGRRPRRD
jgi:Uma2 family endonuclease